MGAFRTELAVALPMACCLLAPRAASGGEPDMTPIGGLIYVPLAPFEQPAGERSMAVNVTVASHSTVEERAGERLLIDGETVRVEATWRWSIGDSWSFDATVPWVSHASGGLDGLINRWHDVFGLPDGDRGQLPEDALAFVYAVNGSNLIERRRASSGPGDVRASMTRSLPVGGPFRLVASAFIKLPTGSAARLTGSDAIDGGIAIGAEWRSGAGGWRVAGSTGLVRAGRPDIDNLATASVIPFANAAVRWRAHRLVDIDAEIAFRGETVRSTLRRFSAPAARLKVQAGWRVARDWRLEIGFSEDIRVETHPDVAFHLGLTRSSGLR